MFHLPGNEISGGGIFFHEVMFSIVDLPDNSEISNDKHRPDQSNENGREDFPEQPHLPGFLLPNNQERGQQIAVFVADSGEIALFSPAERGDKGSLIIGIVDQ